MSARPPVFRFAPSPNGRLHLGHAYSALLNAEMAGRMHGRLLVRIEDIDPTRCRPDLAEAMLADLRWLGLRFEEPVRRQSDHLAAYAAALASLQARGLVYPCLCSRREIAQASIGRDPLFLFAALQRQLNYPEVPRPKPKDDVNAVIDSLKTKLRELEARLRMVEGEQRGTFDPTQFGKPDLFRDIKDDEEEGGPRRSG